MKRVFNIGTWLWKRKFGVLIIFVIIGAGVAKEGFFTGLTLPDDLGTGSKRVTHIVDEASANGTPLENLITEFYLQQAIAGLELSGGNSMEVYNVRDYGAIPNVSIPASGATVGGTNQTAAFQAAVNAAPSGAIVFYGSGNWLVTGTITFSTKQVYLIGLGNIYTNGGSPFALAAPGGQDRGHVVIITGKLIGRVNIPTNSNTTRANATSPQWSTFTGTGFTIGINVNNSFVRIKWIEGFRTAFEIQAGSGGGCQENTFEFMRLNNNGVGIRFRHINALGGWIDKTVIHGWGGGTGRITGGLCFEFDGNSSPAGNGEVYNGAGRSNHIEFMAELVDSVIRVNGDFTYNSIYLRAIEGGTNTGVLGADNTAIVMRSVNPNPAFHTKIKWDGVFNAGYLTGGLGFGGTLEGDVWNNNVYIGNSGRIDNSGNVVMNVEPTLTKATRDALPANIKCANLPIAKITRNLDQPTYTTVAADAEGTIISNYSSGSPAIITLGTASSNVDVTIYIQNAHPTNDLVLFNVANKATLGPGEFAAIRCINGSTWQAIGTGTTYTPAP
jgi:hypothetical protein